MNTIFIALTALIVLVGTVYYTGVRNNENPVSVVAVEDVQTRAVDTGTEKPIVDTGTEKPIVDTGTSTKKTGISAVKFGDAMVNNAIEGGNFPIEGFDAFLLLNAYPGLIIEDFIGVKSLEGYYVVKKGVLEYVRSKKQPVTSAEKTISNEGYNLLLINVSRRLDISITNEENLKTIIDRIQASP